MWSVDVNAPKYPIARIFRLVGATDGTEVVQPEVIEGYSNTTNLIVITASFESSSECDAAVKLAQSHGSGRDELPVAVMVGDWKTAPPRNATVIKKAFQLGGAVFVCGQAEVEDLVQRLVRAIVTPGEPYHPWCNDWYDMRVTVGWPIKKITPGRYGFGRAVGESAGTLAAKAAIKGTGMPRGADVHAVAFIRGGPDLMSSLLREVINVFDTLMGPHSSVCKGISVDPEHEVKTVEVDFFYFGECDLLP